MGSEDKEAKVPLKYGERKRKFVKNAEHESDSTSNENNNADNDNDKHIGNSNNEKPMYNDDNNYRPLYNTDKNDDHSVSDEAAKQIKDRGHEKHGWKNIYHKEEWGVNKKFHDVWRDADWKNRFNEEQAAGGKPSTVSGDTQDQVQNYVNSNYEPAESSQHSLTHSPNGDPDKSNVSSASVNVTIWHH